MTTPSPICSAVKAVDSLLEDPHRLLALAYVLSFAAAGWLLRDVPTDPWFLLSALAAVPLTPVVGTALAVATGLFCGLAEGIHDRRRNRDE